MLCAGIEIKCYFCDIVMDSVFGGVGICPQCGHMQDYSVLPCAADYCEDFIAERNDYSPLTEEENDRMLARWDFVLSHSRGAKTLLDYGCARNYFIRCAPEGHGFEKLVGFDTNWMTGFSDERVLDERYDVMTLWHTLEHIIDPIRLLERVSHEYVFLSIPWAEYLDEKTLPAIRIMFPGRHIHFYSRKSIMTLFREYELLEERYVDTLWTGYEKHVVDFAFRRK